MALAEDSTDIGCGSDQEYMCSQVVSQLLMHLSTRLVN